MLFRGEAAAGLEFRALRSLRLSKPLYMSRNLDCHNSKNTMASVHNRIQFFSSQDRIGTYQSTQNCLNRPAAEGFNRFQFKRTIAPWHRITLLTNPSTIQHSSVQSTITTALQLLSVCTSHHIERSHPHMPIFPTFRLKRLTTATHFHATCSCLDQHANAPTLLTCTANRQRYCAALQLPSASTGSHILHWYSHFFSSSFNPSPFPYFYFFRQLTYIAVKLS